MGNKKMDKLVGGHRVEDKFKWSVQIDLDETTSERPRRDNFVTISGTAKDATEAAIAAQKARQAFLDAENAAKGLAGNAETVTDGVPAVSKSPTLGKTGSPANPR